MATFSQILRGLENSSDQTFRETGVSRHYRGLFGGPLKAPGSSQRYRIEGFKVGSYQGPIMPRDSGISNSECFFYPAWSQAQIYINIPINKYTSNKYINIPVYSYTIYVCHL